MVRRRAVAGAQQQQLTKLNLGWLGWPQQPIRRDAIVSNACSKMAGSLPRMPKLRQPQPSSRNLGRLRRGLMNISPLPLANAAAKASQFGAKSEFIAALPKRYKQDKDPILSCYPNRETETIASLSVQLKQQLQELNQQYQQQQMQQQWRLHQQQQLRQERQLEQQQHWKLDKFLPSNFGIWAGNLINSLREPTAEDSSYEDDLGFARQVNRSLTPCKAQQLSRSNSPESQATSGSSAASLTPDRSKVKGSAMATAAPSLASLQAAKLEPSESMATLPERTTGYCTRQNSAVNLAQAESSRLATLGPSRLLTPQSLATLREAALHAGNANLERQLKLTMDQFELLQRLLQQELAAKDEANSKEASESRLQDAYAAPEAEAERLKAGVVRGSYSGHSEDQPWSLAPEKPKPATRMFRGDPAPDPPLSNRSRSVKMMSCVELSSRRPLQWPLPRYLSGWAQLLPPLERKRKTKKHLPVGHQSRLRRNRHDILDRSRHPTNGMLGASP